MSRLSTSVTEVMCTVSFSFIRGKFLDPNFVAVLNLLDEVSAFGGGGFSFGLRFRAFR